MAHLVNHIKTRYLRGASFTSLSTVLFFSAATATLPACNDEPAQSLSPEAVASTRVLALSANWVEIVFPPGTVPPGDPAAYSIVDPATGDSLTVTEVFVTGSTALLATAPQSAAAYSLSGPGVPEPIKFQSSSFTDGGLIAVAPLDNEHVALTFSKPLDAGWGNVENFSIDSPNLTIHSATLSDDRKLVVLATSPQEAREYSVRVNVLMSGGTGQANAQRLDPAQTTRSFSGIAQRDEVAPQLVAATALDSQTLLLTFSEALDSDADDRLTNFTVDGELALVSARLTSENTQVVLKMLPMVMGQSYTVSVSDVYDVARNAIDAAAAAQTFSLEPLTDGDLLPRVVGAISRSNTEVLIRFNRPMSDAAGDPASYSIVQENVNSEVGALSVSAAQFLDGSDRSAVVLTTASQSEVTYRVSVTNVTDQAGNHFPAPDAGLSVVFPSEFVFAGTPASGADQLVDTDGDGLTDDVEQRGYQIPVTLSGGHIELRQVTSSPLHPDTDGDGVSDRDEMHFGSDARRADTDGDSLTDHQELNQIYSNPADQDSDGDGLQDGLEFDFFRTSPLLLDTDGDQIEDFEEITAGNRNPLVADIPVPKITIGNLNMQLQTLFNFTDETGTETSAESSTSSSLSQSENQTYATSDENSTLSTLEVSQSLSAELTFDLPPGGSISSSLTVTNGLQRGHTSSFSTESAQATEEAYEKSLSTSRTVDQSKSVTRDVVGASLKADVTVSNASNIPFTVSNLELSVQAQDPRNRRRMIPIASLVPENAGLESVNIGALGDPARGPFVFAAAAGSIFPDEVEGLMKSPRGVIVKLANFDIIDESGRNFVFTSRDILDRTAGISIDFGDGRSETYRVATNSTHSAAGVPEGITMGYALGSILGLDYETADREVDSDGDNTPDITENILVRVEDLETTGADDASTPDLDETQQFWVVYSSRNSLSSSRFDDIVLKAGDQYNFAFVQDLDKDGVWAREEYLHGSSDRHKDSDGDGLDDQVEIQEGWTVQVLGGTSAAYKIYPNPVAADSDRDGIGDAAERACGLDPRQADTDLDGLSDYEELFAKVNTNGVFGEMYVRDPATGRIIASVPQYTGDAPSEYSDLVRHEIGPFTAQCNEALGIVGYATDPLTADTDGDSILDGAELALGIDPNDASDGPLFLDDDFDGIPNSIELNGWERVVNGSSVRFTSSPINPDSDDDGLPDLLEYYIGSDPESLDTDGDTLSDLNEYKGEGQACVTEAAGNPCVAFTQPLELNYSRFLRACTEADACDYDEGTLLEFSSQLGTNVSEADTDGDGVPDGEELSERVITVNGAPVKLAAPSSDAMVADTDADGWDDGTEVGAGTDPRSVDTDGDGTEDDEEHAQRSPTTADRFITLTYTSLDLVLPIERQARWVFAYSHAPTDTLSDPNLTRPEWYHVDSWISGALDGERSFDLGGSRSFVAAFGDAFYLWGSVGTKPALCLELDGDCAISEAKGQGKLVVDANLASRDVYLCSGKNWGDTVSAEPCTAAWSVKGAITVQ